MWLEILVWTNGTLDYIDSFLRCVFLQTLLPSKITILLYPDISADTLESFCQRVVQLTPQDFGGSIHIHSHLTHEFTPWQWHGHDRAYLVSQATEEYIYMIDHDNEFERDLFEQTMNRYTTISQELETTCLVAPLVMRWRTGQVQSRGITSFSYSFPKYGWVQWFTHPFVANTAVETSQQKWHCAYMMWANSLFGPRSIFQQVQFDSELKYCYEDLDFTRRSILAWYPLVVLDQVEIYHMEPERTKLEHLLLWTPKMVYRRSRNRCVFVKKTATRWQLFQYFFCGLWIQTLWFMLVITLYGKKSRRAMLRTLVRWTWAGICRRKE